MNPTTSAPLPASPVRQSALRTLDAQGNHDLSRCAGHSDSSTLSMARLERSLNILRLDITDKWNRYIDLGIRFYALPIQEIVFSGHIHGEAVALARLAFFRDVERPMPRFMHGLFYTAGECISLCENDLVEGNEAFLRMRLQEAETRLAGFWNCVDDIEWAVEEMIAVRNMMSARGQLPLVRTTEAEIMAHFEDWVGHVKHMADAMNGGINNRCEQRPRE